MILDVLSRIAEHRMWYLAISQTALFAFAGLAVWAAFSRRLHERLARPFGTASFLGLGLLVLLAARWPAFFVPDMLNQDEAQALAQAITALHDPVPWLSFDGNTCGPLNTYVLMLPALFGAHLSFLSTRIISVLLEFGAAAALYGCVTLVFDAALARIAIVPPIAFFALVTQAEFVHYSGERLSIFLGMLALWLVCVSVQRRSQAAWLFAVGFVAGMIPFAKIQAVPLDAATVAVAVASILAYAPFGARQRVARLAALVAGGLAFPAALLAVVAAHGAFHDFWISYIASSIAYILWTYQPLSFVTRMPEFGRQFDLLLAVTMAGGVALALCWKRLGPGPRGAYLAALVVLAGALDAIFAPKRGTWHYVLFGMFPAACAAAAGLGLIAASFRSKDAAGPRRGWIALVFVAASLAAQAAFTRSDYPYLGALAEYKQGLADPTAALVRRYLAEGDRLAIWGYRPRYFVLSYTLLGTRDAIGKYQWTDNANPYLAYYRARYIRDMTLNRPRGFLDVGPESFDLDEAKKYGHEVFPELAGLVRRDYRLVGTIRGSRFYVRRDVPDPGLPN